MMKVDQKEEEGVLEPMSPTAQYLKSSALSLTILGVMESEIPIDDSMIMPWLKNVFVPIHPLFSSIMVTKKGVKKWKKVEVNLEDHINIPTFPNNMPVKYYDECFTEYLSNLSSEQLPPNRPLWEVHIIKYPTKDAAGNIIFKLHHSLGDGYSLMGVLLSCLQRVDNPLVPLTFPSRQSTTLSEHNNRGTHGYLRSVPRFLTGLYHTAYDFGWGALKSSLMKDDESPIRSGEDGIEFRPTITCTITFSIEQIKEIKSKVKVTINDVITGVINFGTRIYMQKKSQESGKAKCTALVVLNTRTMVGYKSVSEMIKPNAEMPWGNRFTFLQVPIPELISETKNSLEFVMKARQMIKRQRNSAVVSLTGQLLALINKIRGPEGTAQYIHGTLKNASMGLTNLIGPVEKTMLANHPIKGIYFVVPGAPLSLTITMMSYVGKLRVALTVDKTLIDPIMLKSCIEYAFEAISKAAVDSPPTTTKS